MVAAKDTIGDRLKRVRERIAAAADRARRDPAGVKLVVVTKGAANAAVQQVIELGEMDLGESRVGDLQQRVADVGQFLTRRSDSIPPAIRWHMIGHVQRNKVRPLLPIVQMIHSLDTLRLAEDIDQMAQRLGRKIPVLLEVNCSGESQKFGVAVGAAECLIEQVATLANLELRGAMTMAPRVDGPEKARAIFARMREIFDDIATSRRAGPAFSELSMGMSQDFEVAIEEGATIVRIGTAIFQGE